MCVRGGGGAARPASPRAPGPEVCLLQGKPTPRLLEKAARSVFFPDHPAFVCVQKRGISAGRAGSAGLASWGQGVPSAGPTGEATLVGGRGWGGSRGSGGGRSGQQRPAGVSGPVRGDRAQLGGQVRAGPRSVVGLVSSSLRSEAGAALLPWEVRSLDLVVSLSPYIA